MRPCSVGTVPVHTPCLKVGDDVQTASLDVIAPPFVKPVCTGAGPEPLSSLKFRVPNGKGSSASTQECAWSQQRYFLYLLALSSACPGATGGLHPMACGVEAPVCSMREALALLALPWPP